jgi:hypothetical protein
MENVVPMIILLGIFNGVAILYAFRESVQLTDSHVLVRTSFARLKRIPRERVRGIRVTRKGVDFVGVDELAFATLQRGVYKDVQLLSMASTLRVAIEGPRRPRRLGRLEDALPRI